MKWTIQLVGIVSILATANGVFAQSAEAHKKEAERLHAVLAQEHTFEYMASEFRFEGNVVKNAPYSAEAVTETTQRLADGNRISRKTSATLYRDSEGRTRREEKLGVIGPWASNAEPSPMIFINDPVAYTNLVLDTKNKIARKMPSPRIRREPAEKGASGAGGLETAGIAIAEMKEDALKADLARRVAVEHEGGGRNVIFSSTTSRIELGMEGDKNARSESLGSQMIEGVRADGTRTTVTIPAGAIGNEQPISIISERWYSPELQTVVMTKRSDPRMGETVYRLTNVSRTEPSRSLFEAPPEYTVTHRFDTVVLEGGRSLAIKSKD